MNFWKIAWRNLIRHRRRNLVTGLSIAFGFAGISLLGGYMLRMEAYLSTQAIYLNHTGHFSIYAQGGLDRSLAEPAKYTLSQEDQGRIFAVLAAMPTQPEFIGRNLRLQGLLTNGCQSYPFIATAVEPQIEVKVREYPQVLKYVPELTRLKQGEGFWREPTSSTLPVLEDDRILISARLASLLNKPIVSGSSLENTAAMNAIIEDCNDPKSKATISSHSAIQLIGNTLSGGFAGADARISGHFTTGLALSEDVAALFPLSFAQKFLDTDRIGFFSVFMPPDVAIPPVIKRLRQTFLDQHLNYEIYSYDDERLSPYYVGAMHFVYVMTAFFLILVCGVISLSVLNSLQISFLERKMEMGTLRALGFRPSLITSLWIREVSMMVTLSLAVGGILTASIASLINALNLRFELVGMADNLQFALRPGVVFPALVWVIFLAATLAVTAFSCGKWAREEITLLLEGA